MSSAVVTAFVALTFAASGIAAPAANADRSLPFGFNTSFPSGPAVATAASDIHPGSIVRMNLDWAAMEPDCVNRLGQPNSGRPLCLTPGPIDFNAGNVQQTLDDIKTQLASDQVKVLLLVTNAPQWAWAPGDGSNPLYPGAAMPVSPDPIALGWWQSFVAQVTNWYITRYGADSLAGLEIYNEENYAPSGWGSRVQPPNGFWYSKILCSAYAGVRSVDATVPVIFGGIAEDSGYEAFLAEAYAARLIPTFPDIRGCMTSIGLHPYTTVSQGVWDDPSDPQSFFQTSLANVQTISCTVFSDCGRPISITEFGVPVGQQVMGGGPITQQVQADWDTKAYQLATQNSAVNMFLVDALFGLAANDPFAVCEAPGAPTLAASALKQMLSGNPAAVASC